VNYIFDISKTFHLKIAALRCHKSQIGTGEQAKKVEDWVRNMNLNMAKGKNFEIAEAFNLVEVPD